ncbi:head-tail connector protein [Wolbachia endosymbiont (group E) of Neria commutata]|uniref:head-tail connector protein n=1 Tax=Wolbachia endosymbiont (group E) of Neria commutata TaxID=3066149 RepID=UPI00313346E4
MLHVVSQGVYLSYGPIRAIISATATISKNQEERRNLKYYFSAVGGYVEFGSYFNTTRVDVVYEAGYENVPEQIKLGIMQHVSDIYRNRSGVSSNLSGIKEVYSPFCEL